LAFGITVPHCHQLIPARVDAANVFHPQLTYMRCSALSSFNDR
jgi:hypothetical protein